MLRLKRNPSAAAQGEIAAAATTYIEGKSWGPDGSNLERRGEDGTPTEFPSPKTISQSSEKMAPFPTEFQSTPRRIFRRLKSLPLITTVGVL